MAPAELIGFLGGGIGVTQTLPQIFRIRRLGHGHGVSLGMWLFMFVSCASWFGYGWRIGSPSQVVTNTINVVLQAIVVVALLPPKPRWYRSPYLFLPIVGVALVVLVNVLPIAVVSVWMIAMTLARLPQMLKSLRNRSLRTESAVSLPSLALAVAALLCWEVWSYLQGSLLVATTTTITLVITLAIAVIEFSGRRADQLAEAEPEAEAV